MITLREVIARVAAFRHRREMDEELDAEVASHLQFAIEENVRRGMPVDEARRRALVRFGGVQQAREGQRASRGLPWLDALLQDLRFALRTLRRDAGFAVVAVLILALGIGANIVVFSVVNTILLRPLPFPEANRLVRIAPKVSKCGASCATYSTDAVQVFQRQNRSFSDVTGFDAFTSPGNWKLTDRPVPMPVTGIDVMDNFFHTLGVQALLGRASFTAEESRPTSAPVVILSYPFWKRQFHADREIVGKAISLDNVPTTVVGVLPESFDFGAVYSPGSNMEIFTPYVYDQVREYGNMIAITGRLKPGVTLPQAQAEANLLFPALPFSVKGGYKGNYTGSLWDLKDFVAGGLRRSLLVLWGAVGLILLIVCVNLSNLLLARAAARSKEFAMRSALGAGRGRILRQLLTESLVLAGAGGLLGLLFAVGGVEYLAHQGSLALPLLSTIHIDSSALWWTLLIAVLSAVIFGIGPGLRVSRGNVQSALKDTAASTTGGRATVHLRTVLVVSEVALACVLLVGAGLLLRSFLRVLDVDLGFQPAHADSIRVDLPNALATPQQLSAYAQDLVNRARAVPGVEVAALTDSLPMSRNRSWGIFAKGKHYEPGELPGTFITVVSPGYFKAIGMRVVRGRDVAWTDDNPKEGAVIVNETVARYLWPNEDPIGRMAVVGGKDARVIGVVSDVRETSAEAPAGWQMYVPITAPQYGANNLDLVVRSRLPAETLQASLLAVLRAHNVSQPAQDVKPVQLLVDHASSPRRFFVTLVGMFAALGLVLASLGIYGVISYGVTQRTQEIGIRMALGATQAKVQLGVLGQTMRMAAFGIVVGAMASVAVSSLLASLLFGTRPNDPGTFAVISTVLLAMALLAGYLPARRASRIDPMAALRNN